MATQKQIEEARAAGYSDEEIMAFLAQMENSQADNSSATQSENFGVDPGVMAFIQNANSVIERVKNTSGRDVAVAGENFLRRIGDNFLGIPKGIGELLAIGAGGFEAVGGEIGEAIGIRTEKDIGERFSQGRDLGRKQFPASALINAPIPDTGDIMAGFEALNEAGKIKSGVPYMSDLGSEFDQARSIQSIKDRAQEAVYPVSTFIGQAGGDVATIAAGRAPFVRGAAEAQQAERAAMTTKIRAAVPAASGAEIKAVVASKLDDIATKAWRGLTEGNVKFSGPLIEKGKSVAGRIKSGTGKALGVGVEGATLELIQGGDPLQMFAFGAGVQGAGSLGLYLSERPVKRLIPAVAGIWATHQLIRTIGPGEKNFFESQDWAFNEIAVGLTLGLMGAVTGSGRFRSEAQEKLPVFFDALTAGQREVTRETFKSLIDSKESNGLSWRILEKLATNPTYFNDNQTDSLGRALMSNKDGAFDKEIERLMKDSPDFRKKAEDL